MQQNIANTLNTLNFKDTDTDFKIAWVSGARSENKDTLTYRFHHHAFYEIHIITDGSITYGFKDKEVTVFKNQFIIMPKECEHKVSKHSYDFGKLTIAVESLSTSFPVNEALKCSEEMLLLLQYIFLLADKKPLKTKSIHFAFLTFTALLTASADTPYDTDLRVIKAKKLIDDNYDVFFTADEVAKYCHLSLKQLNRLFIRYENISVIDYIHAQKFEYAKKLLLESDLTISEISQKAGFSSAGYFNKFFKSFSGTSPSKYKNTTL